MFGNVNEILYCMKMDCDCVMQLRHQMFQGRNANYTLKGMKKEAATVVWASNEEICLLSCRYIVWHEWLVSFNDEFRKKPMTTSPICMNKLPVLLKFRAMLTVSQGAWHHALHKWGNWHNSSERMYFIYSSLISFTLRSESALETRMTASLEPTKKYSMM